MAHLFFLKQKKVIALYEDIMLPPFFFLLSFSPKLGTKSGDNTAISISTTSFETILFDLSFLEKDKLC